MLVEIDIYGTHILNLVLKGQNGPGMKKDIVGEMIAAAIHSIVIFFSAPRIAPYNCIQQ